MQSLDKISQKVHSSSHVYLGHIQIKNLNELHCVILHVPRLAFFLKIRSSDQSVLTRFLVSYVETNNAFSENCKTV